MPGRNVGPPSGRMPRMPLTLAANYYSSGNVLRNIDSCRSMCVAFTTAGEPDQCLRFYFQC